MDEFNGGGGCGHSGAVGGAAGLRDGIDETRAQALSARKHGMMQG